jgi:arylsulfatase A-like enzyme
MHPFATELSWEDWAIAIRYYYAFTTLIDDQIGRILQHLDATGLSDDTVIVFTADHGETIGTHGGLTDKGFPPFEEVQRIPFIVWLPEAYRGSGPQPGAALDEWVSLVDVYPTLLDWAGASIDEGAIHGRSLRPLLEGQSIPWREEVFVEFFGVNSMMTTTASVRRAPFKYTWNSSSRDDLYDLERDPHELHNLIDDPAHAGDVREMRQALEAWMVETGFPGMGLYRRSRMRDFPY